MPDCFSVAERSRVMSLIRSYGTRCERTVYEVLCKLFEAPFVEEHPADFHGKPDFVVRHARLAVFVDGCFFHACPKHYIQPVQNADYWIKKIRRNKARAKEVKKALEGDGWTVIRIWEHDATSKDGPSRIRARLRRAAKRALA